MRKNDLLRLSCERLGAELEGIAHAPDGMTVFVPGLLPGEEAQVRVVKVEKRCAYGRLAGEILHPSPDRRENDCPAYPRCGGCSGRHMRYEATLEAKRRQVEDCLRRIGGLQAEAEPVLGMEEPVRYRNKTALPVGGTAGAPVIGFYAPRSHSIVPVTDCPNAMRPAPELAGALLRWMRRYGIPPYDENSHSGLVRHLVARVSRLGEVMACVVAKGSALPHEAELAEALARAGADSVLISDNSLRGNVILGHAFRCLRGRETLPDTLCGLRFELSPDAFFQVNPVQCEKLYAAALEEAQLRPEDTACDVYCGAGTISLAMAGRCRRVLGIEAVPAAVRNARRNAALNGIENAEFRDGEAELLLPRLVAEGLRPDVIVVDPPRKGLDPAVVRALHEASPRRIVYVSCNPATLARDAGLLHGLGWQAERVRPVDMFCWTSGVETVVSLSRPMPG